MKYILALMSETIGLVDNPLEPRAPFFKEPNQRIESPTQLSIRHLDYARAIAYKTAGIKFNSDVEQAAYLALVQAADRFEPEGSASFSTYAYKRIRGAVIEEVDSQRKAVIPHELEALPDTTQPTEDDLIDDIHTRELIDRLDEHLSELVPTQREVIELHYLGGLAISQIAKDQGVTFQAVNQRKNLGLSHLSEKLAA